MVQLMMFTVPSEMAMPPPCEQLEHSGSFLEMSSIGAMEECLRRFKSPAAHVVSAVGMDLAGSDRHGSALNKDAATLPNWVTSLISILGTSNGAMERYVTVMVRNRRGCSRYAAERNETHTSVTPTGRWKKV